MTNPIDHAWAVLKANEVVIDGVTYVPQQEQPQQEQPQQQEQPAPTGSDVPWAGRTIANQGGWKDFGRRMMAGFRTRDEQGNRSTMMDKLRGAMEQRQQQLSAPNPEADSPLATEEEKPRSIMDLLPDEDDPEAW